MKIPLFCLFCFFQVPMGLVMVTSLSLLGISLQPSLHTFLTSYMMMLKPCLLKINQSRSFTCTPLGLNPGPFFEVPASQNGLYTIEPSSPLGCLDPTLLGEAKITSQVKGTKHDSFIQMDMEKWRGVQHFCTMSCV